MGNPARVIRDRRADAPSPSTSTAPSSATAAPAAQPATTAPTERPAPTPQPVTPRPQARALAASLGEAAARDVPAILAAAWDRTGRFYLDAAGTAPTVRAHCDAVELGDLVGVVPGPRPAAAHREALLDLARTYPDDYHVLCIGYALTLLGGRVPKQLRANPVAQPQLLIDAVRRLDWAQHAWHAGARLDTIGTALTWALAAEPDNVDHLAARDALLGWLLTQRDPATGLWGQPTADGLREAVNGTYRLVRGTLAQWGVTVASGDVVVDAVLRHVDDGALERPTACDALDVCYLLWWARPSAAGHRGEEVAATAERILRLALDAWRPGAGAPFAPGGTDMTVVSGADPTRPSLQGSEMWLATAWYAADLLGCADALGYTPRGIHRPSPFPLSPGSTRG